MYTKDPKMSKFFFKEFNKSVSLISSSYNYLNANKVTLNNT